MMAMLRALIAFIAKHHFLSVLFYLILLEVLTFGQLAGRVGFYLDDWNMVSQLHFGPQSLPEMVRAYFFGDPKIMPRPVEVVHFIGMYLLFGLKPLGYHVINGVMEVLTAWIAYVVIHRVTANRLIAFISSAIFLLYPIHDSTHYWVVASSATLSLMLYMTSLWCHIEGVSKRSKAILLAGFFLFAVSLFNYECYLPLFPLNVLLALHCSGRLNWRSAVMHSLPYVASILAVLAYGRFVVPMLGTAWMHAVAVDPANFFTTLVRGVEVSIGAEPFKLFFDRLVHDSAWREPKAWLTMAPALVIAALLVVTFADDRIDRRLLRNLAVAGLCIVVCSYTIFGLNEEYQPTLLTFVNRINYAATLGAALLFTAFFLFVSQPAGRFRLSVVSVLVAGFLSFCMLTNWALSRPWTMSWMMQKHVRKVIADNASQFKKGDTIILLNSPRYIMWSPVFDGGWDFQNVARLTLNDPSVGGNVVSERLQIEGDQLVDVAHNFVCARYPFKNMHALVATRSQVMPVKDGAHFVTLVSEHGMGFGLDAETPGIWRNQLKATAGLGLTH